MYKVSYINVYNNTKAMHAGFSYGFNCGEAVNFATGTALIMYFQCFCNVIMKHI